MSESNPMVSVLCITYNQVGYVADMLKGILDQRTPFSFEVLIHDDASTDGTTDILRSYAERNSNIRLFLEEKNRFSEGINYINYMASHHAKGKYIAICEGDDYWTDSQKLESQVAVLESHPEVSLATHAATIVSGVDGKIIGEMGVGAEESLLTTESLVRNWHIPTASFMFRKSDCLSFQNEWQFKTPVGDFPRALYLTTKGNVYYSPKRMSVYRYGSTNSWSSATAKDINRLNKNAISWLEMLENIDQATNGRIHSSLVYSAKSKVMRLYARCGKEKIPRGIAAEAYSSLSTKETIMKLMARMLWFMGFDLQRKTWSGASQWTLVRRSSIES